MKKRKLKLLALMMAASLTFSAGIPVLAMQNEEEELELQRISTQFSDEASDEVAQDENWTEEWIWDSAEENIEKVIYRKYDDVEDKSTFIMKWVYTREDNRWRMYGKDTLDAEPLVLKDGIYRVGVEHDGDTYMELNYSLRVEESDETAGIPDGGWWEERKDENGSYSYHYFLDDDTDSTFPMEGLEAPTKWMANQLVHLDFGDEIHNFWLNEKGCPVKNSWETDTDDYDKMYYFDETGEMATYWKKIDGAYFWFGRADDGVKKTYWQKVYGKYYWLGSDGAMRTGWQKVYGKYYWLGHSNDGAMKTGWQKVYGKWYYLGSANDGAMKTGWQKIYGKWYYLGGANDGAMKTGWQTINGKKYYFGGVNDGAMKTGWQTINGKKYYFGGANDGALKSTK